MGQMYVPMTISKINKCIWDEDTWDIEIYELQNSRRRQSYEVTNFYLNVILHYFTDLVLDRPDQWLKIFKDSLLLKF